MLVIVPAVVGAVTTMVIGGADSMAKAFQVVKVKEFPLRLTVQESPPALTNVTPVGRVSLTVTEVASNGPALLTVMT